MPCPVQDGRHAPSPLPVASELRDCRDNRSVALTTAFPALILSRVSSGRGTAMDPTLETSRRGRSESRPLRSGSLRNWSARRGRRACLLHEPHEDTGKPWSELDNCRKHSRLNFLGMLPVPALKRLRLSR